jgi:GNAT superfamily N-acetyltransferase
LCYKRNDLNLRIEFSAKLSRNDANWAFDLTKSHMETIYENSGYGWDDEDKMRELTEQGARFLLVREFCEGHNNGRLVGFAHFRFTVQGEVMDMMAGDPCLYLWDIQIERSAQGRGLGRHMITLLELIARKEKMSYISIPIQNSDTRSLEWILKVRGFKADFELSNLVGFDPDTEVKIIKNIISIDRIIL